MTTRRQFLLGSVAVAGGVAIGYRLTLPERLPESIELAPGQTALTPYVVLDQHGVTIITPRAEMGQGIHTTLAALVAEELDVAFEDIRVEHGPASELYSNRVLYGPRPYPGRVHRAPTQATGAQSSIRDAFVKMRKAGAAARSMLVQAAAHRLGVDADSLETRRGAVIDPTGAAIPYTELAGLAADIAPPDDPPLKPREDWTLLGRSLPRVDMVGKCTGTARYACDVRLPGLLYATVRRNPGLGGRMLACDPAGAVNMRGVERVIELDNGVIVVATNTWYALRAARELDIQWEQAPYPTTTAGHRRRIESEFAREAYHRPLDVGDVDSALTAARTIEAEYCVPYLAHATMEPMNATALLGDGRLDIWAGNQHPTKAVRIGARLTGLPEEDVRVHTTYMGGGFGRRFELDDVEAAVRAAIALPGRPVQVMYSREEDLTHDTYRPMASARFRGAVSEGIPVAFDLHLSAPSLFVSANARRRQQVGGLPSRVPKQDVSITMGAREQPYRIPNYRVTAYRPDDLLPVGWWRSVGESQNCFFHESIMDELAHAAGADPLEMRLSLIEHAPSRAVLESVAELANWGSSLPAGHARGLAYAFSSGAATAQVIEIRRESAGIRLHRACAAVDVGIALDQRNIEAQVQGSLLFGLSAAIFGEITVTGGKVDQTNFDTYPLLRLHHVPRVEVRIHELGKSIRGVGESATATAAPALGNAIFAATGQRIRELPFRKALAFV